MINLKSFLGLKTYQPLNTIEISRDNLLHNYKVLSSINPKVKVAPVLKSNAYGHGLILVAKILDHVGAPFFCVDSIYEAYELLKVKIKTPILIMGYIEPENLKVKKLPFKYAISTMDLAEAISKYQPDAKIHIFVDTGMHREGVPLENLFEFLEKIKDLNLEIEGLMSHFSSADNPNNPLNKLQTKNFEGALEVLRSQKVYPKYCHLANSDALISTLPKFSTNPARVGIALFGIGRDDNLNPVLSFKTKIVQIKKIRRGDRVGYSGTFTARKSMLIGVLPAGYYDGVDRKLSNKGIVTIDGKECPIIGTVSMNITTIDLSNVHNPYVGQIVLVYSNIRTDKNSIENAAKTSRTIPYDLLVHLASSTKRVIV